ncbi:YqgE/AlgH family protein [Runella zeae]|uniref:YqgE/AlgH family protein n=1 Tax=Runella zeae TaxID=94255 RepID=UPI000410760A|nr:YqgE/AlgH family protein [Runella zeae]
MPSLKPTKGKLLIAEPFLGDPNFERSVVFLCEHNERGTFGLVFNQTTNLFLNDVLQEPVANNLPLYLGGPVEQNTLHFLHRLSFIEDAIPVGENLFWSGDFEQIISILNVGKITEQDIRFFVGYSGWSAGQLDDELKRDSWIVSDTDAAFIFDTPTDQFWRAVLRRMGGEYRVKSHYPTDPRLN